MHPLSSDHSTGHFLAQASTKPGHTQPCRDLPTSSYNCHSGGTRPPSRQAQGAFGALGPRDGASVAGKTCSGVFPGAGWDLQDGPSNLPICKSPLLMSPLPRSSASKRETYSATICGEHLLGVRHYSGHIVEKVRKTQLLPPLQA